MMQYDIIQLSSYRYSIVEFMSMELGREHIVASGSILQLGVAAYFLGVLSCS